MPRSSRRPAGRGRSQLAPDANRSRPGPLTLEQFVWLPGAGLGSATAGLFGQNPWGFSFGFARPLAGGAWLLDAQLDATGFWAASDSGLTYSEPSRTSGHLGVTWRPPLLDVALRLRGARYLYGDQGIEVELERSLGDLDVAFFALRTDGVEVAGVRLGIPVPPLALSIDSAVPIDAGLSSSAALEVATLRAVRPG